MLLFFNKAVISTKCPARELFTVYIEEWVRVMVFNITFNNSSVISWRLVLLVEETGLRRENH
jgi:hypothetical protein